MFTNQNVRFPYSEFYGRANIIVPSRNTYDKFTKYRKHHFPNKPNLIDLSLMLYQIEMINYLSGCLLRNSFRVNDKYTGKDRHMEMYYDDLFQHIKDFKDFLQSINLY